jgi:EpsD family peptidyl-prolyl cis-trans isomerase
LSSENHMISSTNRPLSLSLRPCAVVALALATALAGCGDKKDKPASQTAAKVNKEEITVSQINQVLAQQRAISADQAASANGVILERLIDQELALQKASDQKLDRDPRVMQAIESSRREIIARAYLEKIGEGAPKPAPAEVQAYYDKHPALFSNRRIYNLQEIDLEATPAQVEGLKTVLAASKTFPVFVEYLKTNGVRFQGSEGVRSAEQLPLASVDQFAALKDGQVVFVATPKGAHVIHLVGSRSQPVTLEAARPAIEQYLLNERKRKIIADDLASLRRTAKIEYVGDYSASRPPAPVAASAPAFEKPVMSIAPGTDAAPQIEVAPRDVPAASMPAATLDKGLKGMK